MRIAKEPQTDPRPFDCGARPKVLVTRGPLVESEHFVAYAIADASGRIVECDGDIDRPAYLRSSAKPLICAAIVASGAADRFGLVDAELAVIAGSHSGEPFHLDAVRSILRKIGLDEGALRCGSHPPLSEPCAQALAAAQAKPTAIHNNCSGKHAGVLALAVHRGAPLDDYLNPEHAAQREILDACAELLEVDRGSLPIGVDGCGIPAVAAPLRRSARFFARLSDVELFPAKMRGPLERVRRAMLNNPEFVAGTGRFDTDLMRATHPRVLCKGGAEGFHASAALHKGLGMCLKVADGNSRAVSPFTIERALAVGMISSDEAALLELHRRPAVKNHAGSVVGDIRVAQSLA